MSGWRRVCVYVALAAAASDGVACDPLTEGGWDGTPAMVVRGFLRTLAPSGDDVKLGLALVWTPLGEDHGVLDIESVQVGRNAELGEFELALRTAPAPDLLAGDVSVAVAMFAVVDLNEAAEASAAGTAQALRAIVHGVSEDHYLVYVPDADGARAALTPFIANPIAVRDGFNLAVGLCREGRPSQLLVVSPEQIVVASPDEARAGACIDVFWGAWRSD